MSQTHYRTTEEWAEVLGENVRTLRLLRNLDQRVVAERSGVALNAVKRLEAGQNTTTTTLISVLRTLGRPEWLEFLCPVPGINPLYAAKLKEPRKRIYSKRQRSKPHE